ncbi:hypothetical protein [Pannonibacter indicus]|uniref:hypothetical protein n=1 Tax=Pannonibacter indicus TaxID=466044 RepID=UPI003918D1F2
MKAWRPTAAESRTRLGWLARQACQRLGYRLAVDVPSLRVHGDLGALLREVGARHGVSPELILGKSQAGWIVPARHELMWRLFADGYGYTAIARFLGRDRKTVADGVARHCERAGLPLPGGLYGSEGSYA